MRAISLASGLHLPLSRSRASSLVQVEDLVARVVGGAPTVTEGGVTVGGVLWTEMELFGKLEAKYGARVDLDPHEYD